MLKRNGEPCRYQVPGFAGRLTETEHAAYTEAVAAVDDQLRQLNQAVTDLTEVERQSPGWTELAVKSPSRPGQTLTVPPDEVPWQILRTLSKVARNEVLLCARSSGTQTEFGIVEKFDPNSAYARAQGSCAVFLTSNNLHLLMQDYVANEREAHQMFGEELKATVEESLSEKYPGQDLSRVVKAVGARCSRQPVVAVGNNRTHAITNNVRIRF